MIHITKKTMFHTFLFIFKFSEEHYTLKDAADQSWPNYIGSKREKAQACLTNPVFTPFSLNVAWSGMFLIMGRGGPQNVKIVAPKPPSRQGKTFCVPPPSFKVRLRWCLVYLVKLR